MENSKKGNGIGLKFLISAAAIIVIFAGLKASQSLMAPFFLAVFFALVLMPPLRWLKMKGLSDLSALGVLSVVVLLFGFGIVAILGSSLTSFAKRLPTYQKKLNDSLQFADDRINDLFSRFGQVEESIRESVPSFVSPKKMEPETESEGESDPAETIPVLEVANEGPMIASLPDPRPDDGQTDESTESDPAKNGDRFSLRNAIGLDSLIKYVQSGVRDMLNVASVSFLVVVMVIFMLIEAAQMPAKFRTAFEGRDLSSEYFNRIADDTWKYTKIKTIVSLLTGVATWIGLWFLGVEYSLLWGLLMFFLNFIPNIGPIIASIPPILLALIDQSMTMAVVVTGWLIFVNFLFGYGVEPRYLGEGLGLSSLVVLLSLIFWGWLIGPIGMFLSAPLTMVVKIVLQNDPNTRWIAVLLSDKASTS